METNVSAVMNLKDILTIALSALAFIFAIGSFSLSFTQRSAEDKRGLRKTLSDIIKEIMATNIANNQLEIDHPKSRERNFVEFRRMYNTQRRYLANHGDYICGIIPHIVTDVDCIVLAGAFSRVNDYVRAEKYFVLSVEKAPNNIMKALNMRGLGWFYFNEGNAQKGRKIYDDSLQLELPDTDYVRQIKADTYMFWSRAEGENGYYDECERLRILAKNAAQRIGQSRLREDMLLQIDSDIKYTPNHNNIATNTMGVDSDENSVII